MEASAAPATQPDRIATRSRLAELLPVGLSRHGVVVAGVALAAGSFAVFGASGRALVGAILCPVLVLLAAIDIRHHLLPNAIVFPAIGAVGLAVAAFEAGDFLEHLWAALAVGGFLFIFATVFPAGLGMGDAKVGFLLGLALGSLVLPAMMLALLGVFLAAVWVLLRRGLSARRQAIPFGPFLALGGIAAFFLG